MGPQPRKPQPHAQVHRGPWNFQARAKEFGKASKTVCASHRRSQWCAQDLREGQVMIGRRWISRGKSHTMIFFFLREVGLEKAVP